jgi:hypothetical protein
MTSSIVPGIYPDLSGAVAFQDAATGGVLDIVDMPVLTLARGGKTKRELDAHSRRPGGKGRRSRAAA